MSLYTVVAEWKEGTYFRQVTAENESQAVTRWLGQLETQPIPALGVAARQKLATKIKQGDLQPVALDGLVNAWCSTALVRGSLLLLHLIATASKNGTDVQ